MSKQMETSSNVGKHCDDDLIVIRDWPHGGNGMLNMFRKRARAGIPVKLGYTCDPALHGTE